MYLLGSSAKVAWKQLLDSRDYSTGVQMLKEILGLHALDKMGSQERQLDRQSTQIDSLGNELDQKSGQVSQLQSQLKNAQDDLRHQQMLQALSTSGNQSQREYELEKEVSKYKDEVAQLRELLAKPLWEIAEASPEFKSSFDQHQIAYKAALIQQEAYKGLAHELGNQLGKSIEELQQAISSKVSVLNESLLTEDDKARIQRSEEEKLAARQQEEEREKNILMADELIRDMNAKYGERKA